MRKSVFLFVLLGSTFNFCYAMQDDEEAQGIEMDRMSSSDNGDEVVSKQTLRNRLKRKRRRENNKLRRLLEVNLAKLEERENDSSCVSDCWKEACRCLTMCSILLPLSLTLIIVSILNSDLSFSINLSGFSAVKNLTVLNHVMMESPSFLPISFQNNSVDMFPNATTGISPSWNLTLMQNYTGSQEDPNPFYPSV